MNIKLKKMGPDGGGFEYHDENVNLQGASTEYAQICTRFCEQTEEIKVWS